jgi:recombination protein RecT
MPNGALGQAYLLPFKGAVQLIVGYRGLIELARRSGLISSIQCFVVHEKDSFKYGVGVAGDVLEHTPYDLLPGNSDGDPGKLVAAFCIARFKDGGSHITVMSKREIELVRRSSRSGDTGPWRTHYEEMAKKTVLRRASKMWPMQTETMNEMAKLEEIEACEVVEPQEKKPALLEALADEVEVEDRETER